MVNKYTGGRVLYLTSTHTIEFCIYKVYRGQSDVVTKYTWDSSVVTKYTGYIVM